MAGNWRKLRGPKICQVSSRVWGPQLTVAPDPLGRYAHGITWDMNHYYHAVEEIVQGCARGFSKAYVVQTNCLSLLVSLC